MHWGFGPEGEKRCKIHGSLVFFRIIHLLLQEATEWLYLHRYRPRDTTGITGIPGNCLSDTGAFGGEVGKRWGVGGVGGDEEEGRMVKGTVWPPSFLLHLQEGFKDSSSGPGVDP